MNEQFDMYRILLYVGKEIAFAWWSIYGHICDLLHSHLAHGCPLGMAGGRTGGKCEMVQQKPKNKDKIFPSLATPSLSEFVAIEHTKSYCHNIYTATEFTTQFILFRAFSAIKPSWQQPRFSWSQGDDDEEDENLKIFFFFFPVLLLLLFCCFSSLRSC